VFAPAEEICAGSTVSHPGLRISRTSLPGSPLTHSRTGGCGIMPSNLSRR
jgi:hypothetical protein